MLFSSFCKALSGKVGANDPEAGPFLTPGHEWHDLHEAINGCILNIKTLCLVV